MGRTNADDEVRLLDGVFADEVADDRPGTGWGRALALILGLTVLCVTQATAITPESPPSTLPVLNAAYVAPADPAYFVTLADQLRPPSENPPLPLIDDAPPTRLSGFRVRRLKVIHYAAPLRVAQNDMMLELEAPGAGRAIISLELKY